MLSPKELAELLCVSTHSLKKWRYLDPKDPKYLPAHPLPGGNPQHLFYSTEDIQKWAARHCNAKFGERIVAMLAPPAVYQSLLPAAMAAQITSSLRNQQQPASMTGAGLMGTQQ